MDGAVGMSCRTQIYEKGQGGGGRRNGAGSSRLLGLGQSKDKPRKPHSSQEETGHSSNSKRERVSLKGVESWVPHCVN